MDDPVAPEDSSTPPHGDPLREATAPPPATPGVPRTGASEPEEGTVAPAPMPGAPFTTSEGIALRDGAFRRDADVLDTTALHALARARFVALMLGRRR